MCREKYSLDEIASLRKDAKNYRNFTRVQKYQRNKIEITGKLRHSYDETAKKKRAQKHKKSYKEALIKATKKIIDDAETESTNSEYKQFVEDDTCKGCGHIFDRLFTHLYHSKNTKNCKEKYTSDQLTLLKKRGKELSAIRKANWYEENKAKFANKYQQKKSDIGRKYQQNKSEVAKSRKVRKAAKKAEKEERQRREWLKDGVRYWNDRMIGDIKDSTKRNFKKFRLTVLNEEFIDKLKALESEIDETHKKFNKDIDVFHEKADNLDVSFEDLKILEKNINERVILSTKIGDWHDLKMKIDITMEELSKKIDEVYFHYNFKCDCPKCKSTKNEKLYRPFSCKCLGCNISWQIAKGL